MLLFSQLLFLFVTQSVCSKSNSKETDEESGDVNKLIGKILHAHRFDELADVIAEKAVLRLNDLQEPNYTANYVDNNPISPTLRADDNIDLKLRGHEHGNIDSEAVLKRQVLPEDDLTLRYKHLRQINFSIGSSHNSRETDKEDNQGEVGNDKSFVINREEDNEKHKTVLPQTLFSSENNNYKKMAEKIKLDFEKNIKTRSDEFFEKSLVDRHILISSHEEEEEVDKQTSWSQNRTSDSDQIDLTFRTQSGEKVGQEEKPEIMLRIEGNKTFAFEESPDYIEYHEQRAQVADVVV